MRRYSRSLKTWGTINISVLSLILGALNISNHADKVSYITFGLAVVFIIMIVVGSVLTDGEH